MSVYHPYLSTRFRALDCDWTGGFCLAEEFHGLMEESVVDLRGRARAAGWACQDSGPSHPARDLCPNHTKEGNPRG